MARSVREHVEAVIGTVTSELMFRLGVLEYELETTREELARVQAALAAEKGAPDGGHDRDR
jgi:hypothetical protein